MTASQDLYREASSTFYELARTGSTGLLWPASFDNLGQVFSRLAVLDAEQGEIQAHDHDTLYYRRQEVDNLLLEKSNVGHNHDDRYYTHTEVDALIVGHHHDDRYYTKTELNGGQLDTRYPSRVEVGIRLAGFARLDHQHHYGSLQDLPNLHTLPYARPGHRHPYDSLLGLPDLNSLPYAAVGHNHRLEIEAVAHEFILAGQIFGR